MNLRERKKAFIGLGDGISELLRAGNSDAGNDFKLVLNKAHQKNQWFTPGFVIQSLEAIASWLNQEALDTWLNQYSDKINTLSVTKDIGVIMAGNIPMVGFHDLLCVLISGNKAQVKCATGDEVLIPFLFNILLEKEQRFNEFIRFTDRLEKPDAVIATGGNNSARYFEFYFGKQPHIIRKNRNGIAVLHGRESLSELTNLSDDIFMYYGLGCRNVSKLYIPVNYDFSEFFKAMESQAVIMQHNKYMNNYDYHNTLFLLNSEKFLTNNFLILRENSGIATPVSVLHFEYYDDRSKLLQQLESEKDKIQCIIGNEFIPFGKSQSPALHDYADGIDVMQFLAGLK